MTGPGPRRAERDRPGRASRGFADAAGWRPLSRASLGPPLSAPGCGDARGDARGGCQGGYEVVRSYAAGAGCALSTVGCHGADRDRQRGRPIKPPIRVPGPFGRRVRSGAGPPPRSPRTAPVAPVGGRSDARALTRPVETRPSPSWPPLRAQRHCGPDRPLLALARPLGRSGCPARAAGRSRMCTKRVHAPGSGSALLPARLRRQGCRSRRGRYGGQGGGQG
jgi:hypothetical protein